MKRFFTKTGIWLLGGAAVIAVVLVVWIVHDVVTRERP